MSFNKTELVIKNVISKLEKKWPWHTARQSRDKSLGEISFLIQPVTHLTLLPRAS